MPVTPTSISTLAPFVQNRLQENNPPVFWNLQGEIYAGIVEGINELMLLIGRPTIQYNTLVTLTAGTVWQQIPANVLSITDIRTDKYKLWKTSLHSLDYLMASWGPEWESDTADTPDHWAPLGLNYFIVHPAPVVPIQVTISAITYPVTSNWPYNGTETVPFHEEFFQALEMYATWYCRSKEMTDDASEGNVLYSQFLAIAKRLTTIEDRRDDVIFTASLGSPTTPTQTSRR